MMKIISKLVSLCFIITFVLGNYSYALAGEKPKVAVMNLEGKNVSAMDASIVTDFLRDELYKTGKYIVLERANMEQVLAEQSFQQTGCTNQECAVKVGKLLNVENVIVGSLSKLGTQYYVNVRLVNVESGEIVFSTKEECSSMNGLDEATRNIALKMVGRNPIAHGYDNIVNTGDTYIYKGMEKDGVRYVMGNPDYIIKSSFNTSKERWLYGDSKIYFYKDKVLRWAEVDRDIIKKNEIKINE